MSSNKFPFTVRKLDELTQKGAYYDTHPKAYGLFYIIQTEGKVGSFKVKTRVRNKQLKITIGKYSKLTLEQARHKAAEIQSEVSKGINPTEKKQFHRKRGASLRSYFDRYVELKKLRPRTIQGYQSSFRLVLSLIADKSISDIRYDDVFQCHQYYSKNHSIAEADRAMRLLRAIFNLAIDEIRDQHGNPVILENPVSKLVKNKHTTRLERKQNKLEDDQIKPFMDCMELLSKDKRPYYQTGADLALLLFFHGTRFTESASLKWDQIDIKYKRFYLTETKSGRRLWLPMTSESEKLFNRRKKLSLGSLYVFPSINDSTKYVFDIKKPLKHLTQETGIKISAHDLRRTFLSMGTRLGLSPYILKLLANHMVSTNDVTAGYVIQSAEELREPSQKITNAYLKHANRNIDDGDTLLSELLQGLSEAEKRQLAMKLMNKQLQTA